MSTKLDGRYELGEVLGGHGDVRVFRAVDGTTGESVFIKMMPTTAEDLDSFMRFQEEGAVLSSLDHPNIWKAYSTFIDGDTSCIVLEAFEGITLTQMLQDQHLSLANVKRLIMPIVSAFVYAHGRHIIHGAVNPENIVVRNDGWVKLRDLNERGIGRLVRDGAAPHLGLRDSSPYTPPERLAGQSIDERCDIFSLGAVLYHMITGGPPAGGDLDFGGGVPHAWQVVIAKAMAREPRYRYRTMRELGEALAGLPPKRIGLPEWEAKREGRHCPKCGRAGNGIFCVACGTRLVDE